MIEEERWQAIDSEGLVCVATITSLLCKAMVDSGLPILSAVSIHQDGDRSTNSTRKKTIAKLSVLRSALADSVVSS